MIYSWINSIACMVICLAAMWRAMSPRYRHEGVLVKLLCSWIGLCAALVALGPAYNYKSPPVVEMLLNISLAIAATWVVYVRLHLPENASPPPAPPPI